MAGPSEACGSGGLACSGCFVAVFRRAEGQQLLGRRRIWIGDRYSLILLRGGGGSRYAGTVTTINDRFKRGSCPSWCQTWHADWDLEPEAHDGPHWSTVDTDDGGGVEIATVQNVDGDVLVWVDAEHGSMLTPAQARAAADELLEAGSWVEDQGTHLAVSPEVLTAAVLTSGERRPPEPPGPGLWMRFEQPRPSRPSRLHLAMVYRAGSYL